MTPPYFQDALHLHPPTVITVGFAVVKVCITPAPAAAGAAVVGAEVVGAEVVGAEVVTAAGGGPQ